MSTLRYFIVLRLGKSMEMIYAAKEAMYIQDFILQTCVTLSRISSACFLFLDHILWLHRVRAININIKPISTLCNRFWLLSTIMNLVRNVYDWHRIYQSQRRQSQVGIHHPGFVPETLPTILDSVKNSFDVLIPMHSLQYMHIPGVVQGVTGAVSSVIGIMTVWNDKLKLQNR